ncbi:hypothetical protein THERMOT_510 [Bathymodiolus thermophilus thioautotrophic gill symbiont]|nr:hypothetical protein THERMOT_510 [Bathymodiolus thermophilus thioautotrophic gill symbiont]
MHYSKKIKKSTKKTSIFLISFISNTVFGSIVYPVAIPGTGSTVQKLDFEKEKRGSSDFFYNHGWAGQGYGLTGTQRGAPESIKVGRTPNVKSGFSDSSLFSGKKSLQFYSHIRNSQWHDDHSTGGTKYYSGADKENQDDFFMPIINKKGWVASDTPAVLMHIYTEGISLMDSLQYTSLRMPTVSKFWNGTKARWPGIWIYQNPRNLKYTISLRRPAPSSMDVSFDFPGVKKIQESTWWTLGLSITPNGNIHYFLADSYVENLTMEHYLSSSFQLYDSEKKNRVKVAYQTESVVMISNYATKKHRQSIDDILYTANNAIINAWGTNDRKGKINTIYVYENPYTQKTEYFSLQKLNHHGRYKDFPTDETNNDYWLYLGNVLSEAIKLNQEISKYKHWGDDSRMANLGDEFGYFNPYSKRYEVFKLVGLGRNKKYQSFPVNGGDNYYWKFLKVLGFNVGGNLLKNNNAQEGLKYWNIIENGGKGFASGFYNNSVNKGFNTSYLWNIKEQTIDMNEFGILDDNDKVLVSAEFKDTYCSNDYLLLEVELKDKDHNIINRFSTGKRPTKTPKLCIWNGDRSVEKVSQIIDIPAGKTVHYITYRDGGKDKEFWAGRYGVVISNAKITTERN